MGEMSGNSPENTCWWKKILQQLVDSVYHYLQEVFLHIYQVVSAGFFLHGLGWCHTSLLG